MDREEQAAQRFPGDALGWLSSAAAAARGWARPGGASCAECLARRLGGLGQSSSKAICSSSLTRFVSCSIFSFCVAISRKAQYMARAS